MKVWELIDELNRWEKDMDIYSDYSDEGCAFCGGTFLTEEGKKRFHDVLYLDCKKVPDGRYECAIVKTNGDKETSHKVIDFLFSAAGYCACDDFDRWFINN